MSSDVRFTDFKSDKQPTWCPGCGDFGTMNGMMKALAETGNDPDNTFVVAGGDGDGYSIGAGHFVHAVRRNVDMSYVVMDNRIYGLTKGQFSPTSREEFETSTSPDGTQMSPVNPLALALAAGGTFIAQSFSSDAQRHAEIVQEAIEHDGFGFVNVYSPCVTFNDVDTYDYFRDAIVDVGDEEFDHDRTDYDAAKDLIMDRDKEYQGVIYQDDDSVGFETREGVEAPMTSIPDGAPEDAMDLVREFY